MPCHRTGAAAFGLAVGLIVLGAPVQAADDVSGARAQPYFGDIDEDAPLVIRPDPVVTAAPRAYKAPAAPLASSPPLATSRVLPVEVLSDVEAPASAPPTRVAPPPPAEARPALPKLLIPQAAPGKAEAPTVRRAAYAPVATAWAPAPIQPVELAVTFKKGVSKPSKADLAWLSRLTDNPACGGGIEIRAPLARGATHEDRLARILSPLLVAGVPSESIEVKADPQASGAYTVRCLVSR